MEPFISYDEFNLYFYGRYAQNAALGEQERRYADAFRYALERVTPVIGEDELIVGRCCTPLTDAQKAEWSRLRAEVAEPMNVCAGQDSHMAIDYERLLREGTEGVRARIGRRRKPTGRRGGFSRRAASA